MNIFYKLKDYMFVRKMRKQRAKKGYCDIDVWNVDSFIENKLLDILKEFKIRHNGYPCNITSHEWNKIIDRMIFLLSEMNEETCSVKEVLGDSKSVLFKMEYMTKCKDEFYDLLKKWHYDLWY